MLKRSSRVVTLVLLVAGAALAGEPPAGVEAQAKAHFKAGNVHYEAGTLDLAIEEYQAALKLVPRPILFYNLGQCYRRQGKKREALEQYTRFLKVQPEGKGSAEAREHVVTLTRALDDEAEARPTTPTPTPAPVAPPIQVVPAPTAAIQPPPVSPTPRRRRAWPAAVGAGVGVVLVGAAIGVGVGVGVSQQPAALDVTDGIHTPPFQ